MRKVTREAVEAFNEWRTYNNANTEIKETSDGLLFNLHGNTIAKKNKAEHVLGIFHITNCGYQTNVTKERLNGLPGVSINQIKGTWYLNGKDWDGNWETIIN